MNTNSDEGEEIKINPDFLAYFQDELNVLSRTIYNSDSEDKKEIKKNNKRNNEEDKNNKSVIEKTIINEPPKTINVDVSKEEILYLKSIINFFSNKNIK